MKLRSLFLRACLAALALASAPAQGAKPTFNGKVTASRDLESRIDVTWTALYNATSVSIWRSRTEYLSDATLVATVSVSGAGTWTQGTWSDTTVAVMSAAYFTEFHYWIQASNADGSTLESGKHDKGYRNPGEPGNPRITVQPGGSATGVDLSWTKADYAVTYEIYRGATEAALSNGTATKIGTVSGTSSNLAFTDSGTEPGVKYWYAVNAVNPSGVGRGNHGCSYRAVALSYSPNNLEGLAASAQSKIVTVIANASWTVSKSSDASWVTLGAASGTGNGSFTVSLSRNTTGNRRSAYVTIRAGTGTADPQTSTFRVEQNCIVPSAPTGVSASDGTYTDRIHVSWNASEGAGSYDVYRSLSASGEKTAVGGTSGTSIDDTGVSVLPGMTYYYWVVARSIAGNSSFSDPDTGWKKIKTIAPFSVFRFYSKKYKGHFYTIDEDEKNDLIAKNPNWDYEGVAYRAFKEQASGTVAMHRFYSKKYRSHFFTIDEEEADTVRNTNPNWNYEGIACYVFPNPDEMMGTVPVYRFWSKEYRHHFYTIDEEEKEKLVATNPHWAYERVAFHALPPDGKSSKAAGNAAGKAGCGAAAGVAVTTSDGSDGAAAADGDETTAWSPETADASWVVLSFAEALEVADVEVAGENLPEGTRILLSEDADGWTEEVPGTARYVWVAFPAAEEAPVVKEIRVVP
jgi:hypothetical protein